jgi:hypothetical protein
MKTKVFYVSTALALVLSLVATVLGFPSSPGRMPKVAAETTWYEEFRTSNNATGVFGSQQNCQTFTPSVSHYFDRASFSIFRQGTTTGFIMTIALYNVDLASHKPIGSPLCSTTYDASGLTAIGGWHEFRFNYGYPLSAATEYAIVLSCPSGNSSNLIMVRCTTSGTGYGGGMRGVSADNGANWTMSPTYDLAFREGRSDQPLPSQWYVATTGNDATGSGGPGNPWKTIQYAIHNSLVLGGSTINVAAGTYTEIGQIVIDKNLSIVGADKATAIIKPAGDTGTDGDARGWFLVNSGVAFNLSNVTLDGTGRLVNIAINSHGSGTINNNIIQNMGYNPSGPDYAGRAIALWDASMTVSSNTIQNFGRIGVYVGSGVTAAVIDGNIMTGKGIGDHLDYGVEVERGGVAQIQNNVISNCCGVASVDGSTSAGILATTYYAPGTTASVTGNTITGNTYGIAVGYDATDTAVLTAHNNDIYGNSDYGVFTTSTTVTVNAENNWWGDNSGPLDTSDDSGSGGWYNPNGLGDKVSDLVDYDPWTIHPATWYVATSGSDDNDGSQSNPFLTIQHAVDTAGPGDTINVAAGTYNEAVNIQAKNNMNIIGADKNTTVLKSATTQSWAIPGFPQYDARQAVVRVYASTGINFSSLTFDSDLIKGNNVIQVLYWDSTGTLDNNILKNMSVLDASGGYYEITGYVRAPSYTDGARAQVSFTNNTFIDAGRVGIVTHGYVNALVSKNTFYKTIADFGYAMEISSESTGIIRDNTIYGYDTPAASDGSESAGIYIENCFTAGSPHVTKNVTVERNEVYDCQWALHVGNEFDTYAGDVDILLSLNNNNFHNNVDGGVIVADEDKALGSSVTVSGSGNSLTNNGDYGYYIYTLGDGDITLDLSGQTITGQNTGVMLEETPGSSSYVIAITDGDISGNTTFGVNNTISAITVDATNNWWGDNSGPYQATTNPVGTGNAVSDYVDYDPWTTQGGSDDWYEQFTTLGTGASGVFSGQWLSQTFTPSTSHYLSIVSLCLYKVGVPTYTVTVALYQDGTDDKPVMGTPLCSTTFAASSLTATPTWYNFGFSPGYQVSAGTKYALVLSANSGSMGTMVWAKVNTAGTYSGGMRGYSTDLGNNWTTNPLYDIVFREGQRTPADGWYEQFTTLGYGASGVYSGQWVSQTFTPSTSHYFTAASFCLYRVGIPTYTVTIALYQAGTDDKPVMGTPLSSTTFAASTLSSIATWYTYQFPTAYRVTAGTKYAVVLSATGGSTGTMVMAKTNTTGTYSGGMRAVSGDLGSTWTTNSAYDVVFKEGWL